MKKYAFIVLLSCPYLFGMEIEMNNGSVIEGASYCVCEGYQKTLSTDGRPAGTMYNQAIFYSATGDEIKRVQEEGVDDLRRLLDPSAPKPQPTAYAIRYWPEFNIRFGYTKGLSHFMVFLDKNGNHIKSYYCNKESQKIIHFKKGNTEEVDPFDTIDELDLSLVRGKEPVEVEEAPIQEGFMKGMTGLLKGCSVQ